ncbi:unnamed protein product [Prunus armeniaca]
MDKRADRQFNGNQAGQAGVSRQRDGQQRDQLADMSQASASHNQSRRSLPSISNLRTNMRDRLGPQLAIHARLGPQRNIHERLGPQGGQPGNPHNEDCEERHSTDHSRRINSHRQVTENPSQAQSTNTPPRQRSREGRPLQTNEEVNQPHPNRKGHQRDRPAMCAEDVEKLVNNRLRDLKIGGNFEDALHVEIDRENSSPFTAKIKQAASSKLEHLRTGSIPCHSGRSAASRSLLTSSLKNTLLIGKSRRTDHLFNLHKKPDESLRDYIKRFKAERANIVGCDDQIMSSAFKRGLPSRGGCHLSLPNIGRSLRYSRALRTIGRQPNRHKEG